MNAFKRLSSQKALSLARLILTGAACLACTNSAFAGFVIEGASPHGNEKTEMGQFQPYEVKGAAPFKNPEPALVPQQRRYENAELVVDLAYQSVTQSGPSRITPVDAFADDVPFAEAMMMILPSGWQLYKDKSLGKDDVPQTISFNGNRSMPEVLRQIGDRNALKFHIDWSQSTVMLSKGRAIFAGAKAMKVIPEPVKPAPIIQPVKPVAVAKAPEIKPELKPAAKASSTSSGSAAVVSTPNQIAPITTHAPSTAAVATPPTPRLVTLSIQPGSLRANLERLSKLNGWKDPSWKDENDYILKSSFVVTGNNFAEAISKLLYYNPTVVAEVNTAEQKIYVFEGKGK